jgi:hypothetical protein
MKTIFAIILTLGFSLTAFAGNEGPQASPSEPAKIIAEVIVGIMFAPPTSPRTIRYQIFSTGNTQVVKTMRDGTETAQALKTYSPEEARAIRANVKEIVAGKIFDPNPSMPGCMDAPSVVYKVYKSKGEIEIFHRFNCKNSARKNANQADADMIKILNDLSHSE